MSVWILTQKLSRAEESAITSRTELTLPFDGLPDLSSLANENDFRRLLEQLDPEAPPESIQRKIDRIWPQFTGLALDDVVVVPLPALGEVAIGRICSHYRYQVGQGGADEHSIAVTWYPKHYKLASFGSYRQAITSPYLPLQEVTDKDMREKILVKLPHAYHRLARWKWLLAAIFTLKAIGFLLHSMTQSNPLP